MDLYWAPRVIIEMKKAGEPLGKHYQQALDYWFQAVPNRPKYVVLCNFDELWIYDLNIQLDDPLDKLKLADLPRRPAPIAFLLPHETRPTFENDLVQLTRETAATVAGVFHRLKERRVDQDVAQRFLLQSVMAMFAEDIGLLPMPYFKQAVEDSLSGGDAYDLIFGLFQEMNRGGDTPAGRYKGTRYFNGGLYRDITPIRASARRVGGVTRSHQGRLGRSAARNLRHLVRAVDGEGRAPRLRSALHLRDRHSEGGASFGRRAVDGADRCGHHDP